MNKLLILLPGTSDLFESSKLDKSKYEVHILHASEEATVPDYASLISQPEFLTSYVERAVNYVNKHKITAIMYSHDMSSIVASVVCQRTGLKGPTLDSTFCCLHKYYTRVVDKSDMWFDFIHLDRPAQSWKDKVHYPCFLKAPFLSGSNGNFLISTEKEMVEALANLKELVTPFFTGYSQLFRKYLDLKKFPLAVENIALVEDFIESAPQLSVNGWLDEAGKFTVHCTDQALISQRHRDITLGFVFPQHTLDKFVVMELIKAAQETIQRFGVRNSFVDLEMWNREGNLTLIEINGRIPHPTSEGHKRVFGVSIYEKAVYLVCGELEKLRQYTPSIKHYDGENISGWFMVWTRNEGKARSMIDYQYARSGCIADGAYTNAGPGLQLNVEEDSFVKQVSTSSVNLCSFMLSDTKYTRLVQRAEKVMKKLVLRCEDSEIIQFPVHYEQELTN